jgi:hypothetical protein
MPPLGHKAYDLCRGIYLLTFKPVQQYLANQLDEARERGLPTTAELRSRFGGLGLVADDGNT